MSDFIITADTTMDLPPELIEKYDIRPIASYVNLGDDNKPDWPDLTQEDLFAYVEKTGKLPQTSAANPYDYEVFFSNIREKDDRPIIHIAKTSGASSCYENACAAAENVSGVYCVDSWGIGSGTGLLVLKAAQSDLKSPEALCEMLNEYRTRIECSFVIETVEYLYKGGRCSGGSCQERQGHSDAHLCRQCRTCPGTYRRGLCPQSAGRTAALVFDQTV